MGGTMGICAGGAADEASTMAVGTVGGGDGTGGEEGVAGRTLGQVLGHESDAELAEMAKEVVAGMRRKVRRRRMECGGR